MMILAAILIQAETSFEERRLAVLPGEASAYVTVFSPTGTRVAYVLKLGEKQTVVIGDKAGPEFDDVFIPVFSPSGKTLAYGGISKEESQLLTEGRAESIAGAGTPMFGSGDVMAYILHEAEGNCAVFNGVKGPPHPMMGLDGISRDGKVLVYSVFENRRWRFVVGGREHPDFEGVEGPVAISRDGGTVVYGAIEGSDCFAVVNGEKGAAHYLVTSWAVSPDGKRVAYGAQGDDRKAFVMADGKKGELFEAVGRPVFSADGRHLAYWGQSGSEKVVVLDGKKGRAFDYRYDLSPITFSADGNHIAYRAHLEEAPVIAVDDTASEPYALAGDPVFAPDGKTVAYAAMPRGSRWIVVAGNKKSDAFDEIGPIVFRPDGKRVAFGARIGQELWWKVMDLE